MSVSGLSLNLIMFQSYDDEEVLVASRLYFDVAEQISSALLSSDAASLKRIGLGR